MINIKCSNCEKGFTVKPSRVKGRKFIFCSRKCHHEGMRNREKFKCSICQKEVQKNKSQIKNSKSGKFFCSKSCQTVWRNKKYRGERHKNWKHGNSIKYRSILLNSNKEKKCLICNKDDERILAVHHVDKNRRNNNLDNLVWLCHNCHYLAHHQSKTEDLLMEKISS